VHNVLDVCSGTGDLVLAFAKRAKQIGGKTRFISADFTPSMTRLAKRKFRAAGEVDVQTTVADTMQLPYGDSTFDLVSVAFGIRNVSDIRAGLNEMVRVCRPGGSVAVLEFSHPRNPLFRALYNFYFFSVLPRIGRIISGSKAYLYLPKSVAKFPDTPEFMRILSEAAGQQAKSRRLTFGIATLYHVRIAKQT
jgi:demethylmenaquinone methyltransferase/2-methoxy-6-polyprenyl-1,4-benzoquinol methylase